ncbi:hypothetical protein AWB69_03461 [Caballeronia udeis]|uniref:Uncharacterized protein n=1 Tax=Caballeronia udeis TaxID=1232866 RepID=A0A158GXI2_9BURK|nr:hypothetical protein AWB69_03461 [Caballeronia udeis]
MSHVSVRRSYPAESDANVCLPLRWPTANELAPSSQRRESKLRVPKPATPSTKSVGCGQ